jgi:hypothetical protein
MIFSQTHTVVSKREVGAHFPNQADNTMSGNFLAQAQKPQHITQTQNEKRPCDPLVGPALDSSSVIAPMVGLLVSFVTVNPIPTFQGFGVAVAAQGGKKVVDNKFVQFLLRHQSMLLRNRINLSSCSLPFLCF